MRITLIHALKHSIVPIEASFARLWPDARLMNLLDDSLSADLARDGGLTDAMTERFLRLGRYAAGTGSDAILFTCSARLDAGRVSAVDRTGAETGGRRHGRARSRGSHDP